MRSPLSALVVRLVCAVALLMPCSCCAEPRQRTVAESTVLAIFDLNISGLRERHEPFEIWRSRGNDDQTLLLSSGDINTVTSAFGRKSIRICYVVSIGDEKRNDRCYATAPDWGDPKYSDYLYIGGIFRDPDRHETPLKRQSGSVFAGTKFVASSRSVPLTGELCRRLGALMDPVGGPVTPERIAQHVVCIETPPGSNLQARDLHGSELDIASWKASDSTAGAFYLVPTDARRLDPAKAETSDFDLFAIVKTDQGPPLLAGVERVSAKSHPCRFLVHRVPGLMATYNLKATALAPLIAESVGSVDPSAVKVTFHGFFVGAKRANDGSLLVALPNDVKDADVGISVPSDSPLAYLRAAKSIRSPTDGHPAGEILLSWQIPPLTIKFPGGDSITATPDWANTPEGAGKFDERFVSPGKKGLHYDELVKAILRSKGTDLFKVQLRDAHESPVRVQMSGSTWTLDLTGVSERMAIIKIVSPNPQQCPQIDSAGWTLRAKQGAEERNLAEVAENGVIPYRVLRAASGRELSLHPPLREAGLTKAAVRFSVDALERPTMTVTGEPSCKRIDLSPDMFRGFAPAVLVEMKDGSRYMLVGEADLLPIQANSVRVRAPGQTQWTDMHNAKVPSLTVNDIAAVTPLGLAAFDRTPVTRSKRASLLAACQDRAWQRFFTPRPGLDVYCPDPATTVAVRRGAGHCTVLSANPLSEKFRIGPALTGDKLSWWNGAQWTPLAAAEAQHLTAAPKSTRPGTVYILISAMSMLPGGAKQTPRSAGAKDAFDIILNQAPSTTIPVAGTPSNKQFSANDFLSRWNFASKSLLETMRRKQATRCRIAVAFAGVRKHAFAVGSEIALAHGESNVLSSLQRVPETLIPLDLHFDPKLDASPAGLAEEFVAAQTDLTPGSTLLVIVPEGQAVVARDTDPQRVLRQLHLYGFVEADEKTMIGLISQLPD